MADCRNDGCVNGNYDVTSESDLKEHRNSAREKERIADLMALVPPGLDSGLDVGARDGFLSRLLAERLTQVTALDLEAPGFKHDRVICVRGDATALQFDDASFDLVLCAEVLEHISLVAEASRELARVSRRFLLIGVPYRQDIRVGRSTCAHCGGKNPPWGHLNRFDEARLLELFPGFVCKRKSFVGTTKSSTNAIAVALLDFAGNPYGTYAQDEPCVHCGQKLGAPRSRTVLQRVATKGGIYLQELSTLLARPHGNWLHVLLEKRSKHSPTAGVQVNEFRS